jgi:predicted Zn-dependent peptidase
VEAATVRGKVEEAFSPLQRDFNPWRSFDPEAVWSQPGNRVLPMDWNEAYFIMAFPGPQDMPDRSMMAAIELLDGLLSGNRTARLTNALQEKKGLVSSIGSYMMVNRRAAPFLIYGTCEPSKLDEVRTAILEELAKLAKDGPSSTEMRRVRRQAVTAHLYRLETNAGRASSVGYSMVMVGDTSLYDEYETDLRQVREADVMRVLRAYFVPERASFFVTKRESTP